MKTCGKCGGRLKRIKTQVTKEVEGQSKTFVAIPALQCEKCEAVTLERPEDFDALSKDKSEIVVGISKYYYSNRPLFYFIGILVLLMWIVSLYLFLKG